MQTIYKSKVGAISMLPLTILVGLLIICLITRAWGGVAIMIVSLIFISHLFLNTYYTITADKLQLRSGFLVNICIDINTIKSIKYTSRSLTGAPVLSLDRIEIAYNTYDDICVSPKDKDGFIAALKLVNNNIEVKL